MKRRKVPNDLLRYERERRHWTQEHVLEILKKKIPKLDIGTIARWEHGQNIPRQEHQKILSLLYKRSRRELGWPEQPEAIPFWKVPFPRNAYFTGRDDLLEQLNRDRFIQEARTGLPPDILTGMPGIGKTQVALAYAYVYKQDYQLVAWLDASSPNTLFSDYVAIAKLANLSIQMVQDQGLLKEEVRAWLGTISTWLLVFDNTEDLELLQDYLPEPCPGHVIITTRLPVSGPFPTTPVEVKQWDRDMGVQFLLKRAHIPQMEAAVAREAFEIADLLGGLPLALDQAGAYIEENSISLSRFVQLYKQRRAEILRARGSLIRHYPHSLVTILSMAFEEIAANNPGALTLLRLFAFLAPDSIPEKIVLGNTADVGVELRMLASDEVRFNTAIRALLRYSLIKRNAESATCSLHRLVQEVIQDELEPDVQQTWIERAVRAVNQVFHDPDQVNWSLSQPYLPHALACTTFIETRNLGSADDADLLTKVASYLRRIGNVPKAELLCRHALTIREQKLGSEDPKTAASMSHLAACFNDENRYEEAILWAHRALELQERLLGAQHPDLATTLIILGYAYHHRGEYATAEPYFKRAVAINEACLGPDHPEAALALNDLGALYNDEALTTNDEEKYKQAEACYRRALAIRERILGSDHPLTASTLNNLGTLYNDLGQYEQAEQLLLQALAIDEHIFGANHREVGIDLENLAKAYSGQQKYEVAESSYLLTLKIYENFGRREHPDTAYALTGLGELYGRMQRYEEAQSMLQQALLIMKRALGIEHPSTVKILHELAEVDRDRLYAEGRM